MCVVAVQLILMFSIAVLPVSLFFGPSVHILIITKDNNIATKVILRTQKHYVMSNDVTSFCWRSGTVIGILQVSLYIPASYNSIIAPYSSGTGSMLSSIFVGGFICDFHLASQRV